MEYLKCDLCSIESSDLNDLTCEHRICNDCIYKICLFNKKTIETYNNETEKELHLKCLLCLNGTLKISKRGINEKLNGAAEKRKESDKNLCSIHSQEINVYCNDCRINMCPECFVTHQALPMFASHEAGRTPNATPSKLVNNACSLHDKRPLHYFCADCNSGLCEVCKAIHNEGHRLKLHKDFYNKKKEELKSQFVLPPYSPGEIAKRLDVSDNELKEEVNREVDILREKIQNIVNYLTATSEQLETERQIICEEIDANNIINKTMFNNLIIDLDNISKSTEFDVNCKYLEKISKKNNLAKRELKNEVLPDTINEIKNLIEKCSNKIDSKAILEIKQKESFMPSKSMTLTKSMLSFATKNNVYSSSIILNGHNSVVNCLILLKDGTIASGSGDDTIKIWDSQDKYKPIQTLTGHTSCVYSLIQLEDGRLASGSDTTIRIWDPRDNYRCTHTLNGHTNGVYSFIQLEDGRMASASGDKTIRIWNPQDNFKCNNTLSGHNDSVYCLSLLEGGRIASGSFDNTIRILNPFNMFKCIYTLYGHTNYVSSLLQLKDGKLASGSYDKTIRIWDNQDNYRCLLTITGHTNPIYSLISLQDNRFASASGDKTIRIWTPQDSFKCSLVLVGHTNFIYSLISLNDGRIASGSGDRSIRIWDYANKIK